MFKIYEFHVNNQFLISLWGAADSQPQPSSLEWGLRHRNVGPGGEQVRKWEGLAVGGLQCKAGCEGCQE